MTEFLRTYGAEIEKPVSNIETGEMQGVSQEYFDRLAQAAQERGDKWQYHDSKVDPGIHLGVRSSTFGEQGLDNGFNLLETSLAHTTDPDGLEKLYHLINEDLQLVQEVLAAEGATTINMAIHPLGSTDEKTYKAYVAPKGIYPYIWARGWNHAAGIDAKAQNCPTTGVTAEEAVDALSVVLGFGAAFAGLFANSPIAEGKVTGDKEHRLRLWKKMMKNSISEGDRKTAKFPEKRFRTLADYFEWMYGPGTNIHFVMEGRDYKTGGSLVTIDGNPSVLEYLRQQQWVGRVFDTNKKVVVQPNLDHMEAMQFANFSGARIRWAFDHSKVSVPEFLEALRKNKLEELFTEAAEFIYIEGRDPGANFPDRQLWEMGDEIAQSVIIAPSAIQAGLIKNLSEAKALLGEYPWSLLGKLKEAAIKDGLEGKVDDISVHTLVEKVLAVATRGLTESERWMLAYPESVLNTRKTGADRALEQLGDHTDRESIRELVLTRKVVLPAAK